MTKGISAADRMNRPVWYAKWFVVALYHALLSNIGGWVATREFKLWSFLVISPVIKYFFLFKQLPTARAKKEFTLSVLLDTVQAFILHRVVFVYCVDNYLFSFVYLQALMVLFLELVCYFFMDWRNPDADPNQAKFTVRFTNNPLDYMLMTLISIANYWSGTAVQEHGKPMTGSNVLALLTVVVIGDLGFGVMHYLGHRVPSLWKLHKTHHDYKREELNSLANFYSEVQDGLQMNILNLTTGLAMHLVGGPFAHEIVQIELLFGALYSHCKYPTLFCSYIYFYELDMIDIVMGNQRAQEFHHAHHHNGGVNFTVFGSISDAFIKKLVDPFIGSGSALDRFSSNSKKIQ